MLTEDVAWALLAQHCELLVNTDWAGVDFSHRRWWTDAVRERVDILVKPRGAQTRDEGLRDGARLRLALGVAQAVSLCRGFEPSARMSFWRRVISSLWRGRNCIPCPERFALSPTAFSEVAVTWSGYRSHEEDSFWDGFLHGSPDADALLHAIQNQLRPHWDVDTVPEPVLRATLSRCNSLDPLCLLQNPSPLPFTVNSSPTVIPAALRTILRAALAAPPHVWTAATTQLSVVVDYRVDDNAAATEETLALLARARAASVSRPQLQVTVARLAVQLAPPTLPRRAAPGHATRRGFVARVRALGVVLRCVLLWSADEAMWPPSPAPTVALFGCSHTDFRLVGAALSAVAWATATSTVTSAELRCSGIFDVSRPQHMLMRLAWLAYALETRRRRKCPIEKLSLVSHGTALDARECAYIQQLTAHGTPLRDVVGEMLRLRVGGDDAGVAHLRAVCLRVGSTVRLAHGTLLYIEPMRLGDKFVATTLDAGGGGGDGADVGVELDLVAHVADHGGFVGVVYAGFGLLWAEAASVLAWRRLEEEEEMDNGDVALSEDDEDTYHGVGNALLSLALHFVDGCEVPPTKKPLALRARGAVALLASSSLASLTIDRALVLRDDLALILSICPRLKTLVLDRCVVESVEPLYTENRGQRTRITTLSLLGVRDLRFTHMLLEYSLSLATTRTAMARQGDAPEWIASFVTAITARAASSNALCALRELRFDVRAMPSEHDEGAVVETLGRAVASGVLPLTRLHVTYSSTSSFDACAAHLEPLRDVELVEADPPRVRLAALSVLRVRQCAIREVAHAVLALAQRWVVRTVTWDTVANS